MKLLTKTEATQWLKRNGVNNKKINEVIGAFDFKKAVYEHLLLGGDTLFQYIRMPEQGNLNPDRGDWYCLEGARPKHLAISEGLAGRRLHKFLVTYPVAVLEGTAAPQEHSWSWAGGGPGGATQIFVPPSKAMLIQAVDAQERW